MKFNRIILVSILLLIFAVGAVSAADENITDTADDVLSSEPADELEVSEGDFGELSSLVSGTSSGKTLTLDKDYINSQSSNRVTISKAITIDGQGHTIDANGKSNIFHVNNAKVTLKNINFKNSFTKNYSAVYGTCTIINCTFTDCTTEKNGGAIYNGTAYDSTFINCKACSEDTNHDYYFYDNKLPPYCQGGAIFNGDAYNCYFENCNAKFIYDYEYVTWDDTHETTGDSGRGGAISDGNAYDCSFIKCHTNMGGAINNGNATNCYFDNCYAETRDISYINDGNGGAIYNGNAANCSFTNCYAKDRGGAIYQGDASNCTFTNCSATWGGAAFGTKKGDMNNITNCSFENCYAKYHGGATYFYRAYDCSFKNCSTNSQGGAMYAGCASNCTFENCHAHSYKVGAYEYDGEGGAIYGGYYTLSASGCYFLNCSADKRGGAIYGGNAADSTFINCTSKNKDIIYKGNYTNCIILPFTFSCSNLTVNYGEGGVLQIRTVENSNGVKINVKIYKDNKLVNSFTSKTGSDLPIDAAPGNYLFALTCQYAKPLNVSVVVNKGSPKLTLANNFAKSGETANVKVTMSKKATGFVRITINGKTYREQISSGVASVDVPNLPDGAYSVEMTYNGNTYHTAETITDTFHVGKFKQGMKLAAKNIKVGETERLTATLAKDATGFVRFIIGEDTYKVAIENGAAYVDIGNLKAGTYSVTLKYAGNYKYAAETVSKTFTVSKSSPGITITANNINVGQSETIKVNLAKDAPGNVQITVNGESQKVKISNGQATLELSDLKAGTYEVSAKYAGNYKYNAQIVSKTFTVSKSSPGLKVTATNIDFGVKDITANLASDATGDVIITADGKTYNVPINNGVAKYRISGLKAGTYDISVKYPGDDKYNSQTVKRSVTVKKVIPTISVTAKTSAGKTIITGKINSDAAGNLRITYEGTTYIVKITNGAATATIDGIIPGSHNVEVKYGGNYKYEAATITKTITI